MKNKIRGLVHVMGPRSTVHYFKKGARHCNYSRNFPHFVSRKEAIDGGKDDYLDLGNDFTLTIVYHYFDKEETQDLI